MNRLKDQLYKNNILFGTWCSLSSPNAVNSIGQSGLDFCVLDIEHGSASFETLENMVRAAEVTNCVPIIRSWDSYQPNLLRCLETGVKSILVPNVNSKKQVKEIVNYCRYFPQGSRGLSPYTRCHNFSDDDLENKLISSNEDLLIGILVEGKNGLNELDDICSVDGLDLVYLGLFDICQSLGLPGQLEHPKVIDKLSEYKETITKNGKIPGCMSATVEYANLLKKIGYNFIAYLNDAAALKYFFTDFKSEIK